jgi:acyl phosphate:glycerol-3-phosphate acyltransferase
MNIVLFMLFAYICGSIPFGKLVGALHGIDIQKRGSGNIGFANVRRVLGWRAGLITLAGDIAKGALPTVIALHFVGATAAFWIGLCAIAGHVFPVWITFRGGKGVATGLGLLCILHPIPAAAGVIVYIASCLVLRNSGISSVIGVACVVIVGSFMTPSDWWQFTVLFATALWTLRKNIAGTVPEYDI